MYNIICALICLIFGYLIGSISNSIWIGKVFFHQDPRDCGSKNAGGTNSGRLWGKKVGLIIIILDMLKTILPVWICWAILTYVPIGEKALVPTAAMFASGNIDGYAIPWPIYWLATLGSILGHCFPLYYRFRGGKAAASYMGTLLGTTWMMGLSSGIVFLITLKFDKHVSLASIVASIFGTIFSWIWSILLLCNVLPPAIELLPMYGMSLYPNYVFSIILTITTIILIIKHRTNIKRLVDGNERKITWM